jgi:hypothetical protein
LVRQRSAKTGESYAAALRQLQHSKETSVTTPEPEPETEAKTCRLCGAPDTPEAPLLRVGRTRICGGCHDRFLDIFRTHLEPAAAEHAVTLDSVMSTVVYDTTKDGDWKVNLHTFRPGVVIGRRGATAAAIRASLVELTGDPRFHLNLVEHGHPGCTSKPPRADRPSNPSPSGDPAS